ncbi:MAG: hypothetical protein ACRD4V_07615 [Candidatus Acidiferrales bacterium]
MKKIKAAGRLLIFLTERQTDASGMVNYGRPISYAWIRAHWTGNPDDRPGERTLKRHMAMLRKNGCARVRRLGFGAGMIVQLLGSAKWRNERSAPAAQLSLFSTVTPIRSAKPVEKPVEKLWKPSVSNRHMGPEVALVRGQKWPLKEVKKYIEETIKGVASAHAMPRVGLSETELDARRRFLLGQAETLMKRTAKSSR